MTKLSFTHANIIHLLGIGALPLHERKEIVESALELVDTRTINRVMGKLKQPDRKKFLESLESEDLDSVKKLLDKNKIDLLKITEEEVENLKREFIELVR